MALKTNIILPSINIIMAISPLIRSTIISKLAPTKNEIKAIKRNFPFNIISSCPDFNDFATNINPVAVTIAIRVMKYRFTHKLKVASHGPSNTPITDGSVKI